MIKCLLDRVNYYRPYNMGLKICASTCVKKKKQAVYVYVGSISAGHKERNTLVIKNNNNNNK